MRPKCSKKRILILIIVYVICLLYLTNWLKLCLHDENIDEHNVSYQILRNYSLSEVELSLQKFLRRYPMKNTIINPRNWFKVANNTYVYSAYHGRCPSHFDTSRCIQFIGITLNATNSFSMDNNLKCSFKKNSTVIEGSTALIERLPEGHFLPFTAAYFYCDLKSFKNSLSLPEGVALYHGQPFSWFPLQTNVYRNPPHYISVSLCVRPLYDYFSDLYLIQFLSYYSTMGVDHFVFYNHNASESVLRFLNFVKLTHLSVEVQPWDIPLSNSQIQEYGQIAFTQDCLARNRRNKYSHTVIVDLDEFIVPKQHKNIVELVLYLDSYYPKAGSFVIPMVLFCEEFSSNKSDAFPILHHTKRQKTHWYHGYRSKYIAISDRVKTGGVHVVWELVDDYYEVQLPPSLVLLHHYRHCSGMSQTYFFHLFEFPVLCDEIVIDDTLTKHTSEILNHDLFKLAFSPKALSNST